MRCPYCHLDHDKVLSTRSTEDNYGVRRRRSCQGCGRKFTTIERVSAINMRVVKRNNLREPFDREKIRMGVDRACNKRKVSTNQVEEIVQLVEIEVYRDFDSEVPAERIGEMILRHLATRDEVAYIRFASVYREFETLDDFIDELTRF
ncbi:MAG: transcriptional regulator NrdR, partial [Planctomycetota bacterium]